VLRLVRLLGGCQHALVGCAGGLISPTSESPYRRRDHTSQDADDQDDDEQFDKGEAVRATA
jgi:hypothetical protein